MKKCINFTGRKRISQEHIDLEVYDGNPRRFDATIDLDGLDLPKDASVFVEAMCAGSTVIQRFPFGMASDIKPPLNRRLDQLNGENVFFRVKVIDQSETVGRILGIAEKIRPARAGKQTATGRRGILPIETAPLGQLLWRLEYGETDVCLLLNESIAGIKEKARFDRAFQALVYPAVIREILIRAISNDAADDDDGDKWDVLWLKFARNIHPDRDSAPRDRQLDDEHFEWIDAVVDAFSSEHRLKDHCLQQWRSTAGDET